jgi:hypothetical protein
MTDDEQRSAGERAIVSMVSLKKILRLIVLAGARRPHINAPWSGGVRMGHIRNPRPATLRVAAAQLMRRQRPVAEICPVHYALLR